MNYYAFNYFFSAILTAVTTFLLALFVYLRNPKSKLYRLFTVYTLSISAWSLPYAFMAYVPTEQLALILGHTFHFGVTFISVFFLHFVFVLLNVDENKIKRIMKPLYLVAVIFTVLVPTKWHVSGVTPKFGLNYFVNPGPAYFSYVVFWIGCVIYGMYKLFEGYLTSTGARRNQLKYLFFGSFIGYILGPANFLLVFDIKYPFYPFGTYGVPIYAAITAYAIIRYRLLDIKVAITRAGIFVIVYTLVLGVPLGLTGWGKPWLLGLFGPNWYWAPIILAIILATVGPFLYLFLQRRAEDILLRDQRRYQRALRELSKTMTRIRDLDKLLRMIVLTVVDTVKVAYAGIYLKEEEYKSYGLKHCYPKKEQSHFQEFIPLDSPLIKTLYQQKRPLIHEEISSLPNLSLDSGLVIPCFMEDELLGFLIMGAKPENQIYTSDDMLVFETLSYSTSLAIENCRFWKEIEDRQRKARLQEIDNYSYSLAHEIDNPMQVILGEAGFLKKFFLEEISLPEEKQKEAQEMLDFILEAAQRVSAMVKAIREFGQKTSGKFKPLNIADVAESFARLYYPQFKDKNVIFEKTLDLKAPVFVLGEKPELMQVLVILANNSIHAMKYSQEKRISLKIEQPNSLLVRISFTDTGCGIKKELLPIIFSPFTTTKASSEGTGMGLYNAKKIIDRHKGKIWAESEGENMGATFFIELPIAKDVKSEELEERDKDKRLF
jgi:signal transduction histidine kinase